MVVVWDDPAVIAEIKRRLDARRIPVGIAARDALRALAGLPPFPAGLPEEEGK